MLLIDRKNEWDHKIEKEREGNNLLRLANEIVCQKSGIEFLDRGMLISW